MPESPVRFSPSLKGLLPLAGIMIFATLWLLIYLLAIFGALGLFLAPIIYLAVLFFGYLNLTNIWVEVREEGLFIQRGIIAKKRILLMFSEIQDIKETQDLISMILGIKSIAIVTMTQLSAVAGTLPAFNTSDIEELRRQVFARIGSVKKAGETTPMAEQLPEEFTENPQPIRAGRYLFAIIAVSFCLFVFLAAAAFLLSVAYGIDFVGTMIGLFFMAVLFTFIGAFNMVIRLATTDYRTGRSRIEMEFGLLSRFKVSIPYGKIQDIILKRGPLERIAGLASLRVETGSREIYAGNNRQQSFSLNVLPALLRSGAVGMREFLLQKMNCRIAEEAPVLVHELPLEARKPLKKTVSFIPVMIIAIAVILGIVYWAAPEFLLTWALPLIAFFAVLLILKFIYEIVYLKGYYYNFAQDVLVIRKGVFTIKEITVPFSLVQNVFVDQDIFDRAFSLWDVHLSTVTFRSEMQCHIDGLSEQNAKSLNELLLKRIRQ